MKNILLSFVFLAACTPQTADLRDASMKELLMIDSQMSDLASREGFNKALLSFADDSLIKPEEGKLPVIGKQSLEAIWAGKEDTRGITWSPYRADAASSGDLGYTLGNWKYVTADTTLYGHYYTIWKRQPDGSWKWIVDGGNNTPAPSN